jgi:AraC family transcriptional regulator
LDVDHLAHALAHRLLALWGLLRTGTKRGAAAFLTRGIRRVLERMHANVSADLPLEELAKDSGLSRNHFICVFEHNTGETLHRYLLRLRVERAKAMIRKKGCA